MLDVIALWLDNNYPKGFKADVLIAGKPWKITAWKRFYRPWFFGKERTAINITMIEVKDANRD